MDAPLGSVDLGQRTVHYKLLKINNLLMPKNQLLLWQSRSRPAFLDRYRSEFLC